MQSFFSKLISPRLPSTAIGVECGYASAVLLERQRRDSYSIRRAAVVSFSESLVTPSFDEPNVSDPQELAAALRDLATSAGLLRQRKWSACLPEGSSRAAILTLESKPGSRAELDEVLAWKIERAFGAAPDELRVSRERLEPDPQGRPRFLAVAARASVVHEFESVFAVLGWRAGMIVPRHSGEEQWLLRGRAIGDGLLISNHREGFTAVVMRNDKPLILRSVFCDDEDRADELYRLLLFYRDRIGEGGEGVTAGSIDRLLVVGDGSLRTQISTIVNDTLGTSLRALGADDVGLSLPRGQLTFDAIAAPAGLASLAWA